MFTHVYDAFQSFSVNHIFLLANIVQTNYYISRKLYIHIYVMGIIEIKEQFSRKLFDWIPSSEHRLFLVKHGGRFQGDLHFLFFHGMLHFLCLECNNSYGEKTSMQQDIIKAVRTETHTLICKLTMLYVIIYVRII